MDQAVAEPQRRRQFSQRFREKLENSRRDLIASCQRMFFHIVRKDDQVVCSDDDDDEMPVHRRLVSYFAAHADSDSDSDAAENEAIRNIVANFQRNGPPVDRSVLCTFVTRVPFPRFYGHQQPTLPLFRPLWVVVAVKSRYVFELWYHYPTLKRALFEHLLFEWKAYNRKFRRMRKRQKCLEDFDDYDMEELDFDWIEDLFPDDKKEDDDEDDDEDDGVVKNRENDDDKCDGTEETRKTDGAGASRELTGRSANEKQDGDPQESTEKSEAGGGGGESRESSGKVEAEKTDQDCESRELAEKIEDNEPRESTEKVKADKMDQDNEPRELTAKVEVDKMDQDNEPRESTEKVEAGKMDRDNEHRESTAKVEAGKPRELIAKVEAGEPRELTGEIVSEKTEQMKLGSIEPRGSSEQTVSAKIDGTGELDNDVGNSAGAETATKRKRSEDDSDEGDSDDGDDDGDDDGEELFVYENLRPYDVVSSQADAIAARFARRWYECKQMFPTATPSEFYNFLRESKDDPDNDLFIESRGFSELVDLARDVAYGALPKRREIRDVLFAIEDTYMWGERLGSRSHIDLLKGAALDVHVRLNDAATEYMTVIENNLYLYRGHDLWMS